MEHRVNNKVGTNKNFNLFILSSFGLRNLIVMIKYVNKNTGANIYLGII